MPKRRKQTPGTVNYDALSIDGLPVCPIHRFVGPRDCQGCQPRREALEWEVARANTSIKTTENIRATMLRIRAENEAEERRARIESIRELEVMGADAVLTLMFDD